MKKVWLFLYGIAYCIVQYKGEFISSLYYIMQRQPRAADYGDPDFMEAPA